MADDQNPKQPLSSAPGRRALGWLRKYLLVFLMLPLFLLLGGYFAYWSWTASTEMFVGWRRQPRPDPALIVEAIYPGANAQVVEETVAIPIEMQITGADHIVHLSTRCVDETCTITVAFTPGVDLSMAQVLVENRVSLASVLLPDLVKRHGVTVKKKSPGPLLFVTLISPDKSLDAVYLAEYASYRVVDELARLPHVSEVVLLGRTQGSGRLLLDAEKLAARGLTRADVIKSLREKGGLILSVPPEQAKASIPISLPTIQLRDVEELKKFIVKKDATGHPVCLQDVALLFVVPPESFENNLDGHPVVTLAISPTADFRPLALRAAVAERLAQLHEMMPRGLDFQVVVDFTPNLMAPNKPNSGYLLLELGQTGDTSPERIAKTFRSCQTLLQAISGVQHVLILPEHPYHPIRKRPCILVQLAPGAAKVTERASLMQTIRSQLEKIPDLVPRLRDLSAPDFSLSGDYPIHLALSGQERSDLEKMGRRLVERLRQTGKVTDAAENFDAKAIPCIYLDIDRTALGRLSVTADDIFAALKKAGISLEHSTPDAVERAKKLEIPTGQGTTILLSAVAEIRLVTGPPMNSRLDGLPMVEITANLASNASLAEMQVLCQTLAEEVRQELRLSNPPRLTWMR